MEEKNKKQNEKKIAEFIPLSEASIMTGYTPEYLNFLSRKEKLKAQKIGRNWYTKTEWVKEFLAFAASQDETGVESAETNELTEEKVGPVLEEKIEAKQASQTIRTEKVSFEFEQSKGDEIDTQPKNTWLKILAFASSAIILIPLLFAGTYATKKFIRSQSGTANILESYWDNENLESKIVNENFGTGSPQFGEAGQVAGEETGVAGGSRILLASENYRVSDLNIGGDMLILANGENDPIEINNIKSESFVSAKKDEVKLVVSWQTNKMAISELSYAKNNGQDSEVAKEDSYGFIHSAVIPGLDPGTSYVYQIKCRDRWANELVSEFFGVYTSSKPISVFELIANAIGEVFGWAIKK